MRPPTHNARLAALGYCDCRCHADAAAPCTCGAPEWTRSAPDPASEVHRHRFALPSAPDRAGVYLGVCSCGATREHRPYGAAETSRAAGQGTPELDLQSLTRKQRQALDRSRKSNASAYATLGKTLYKPRAVS